MLRAGRCRRAGDGLAARAAQDAARRPRAAGARMPRTGWPRAAASKPRRGLVADVSSERATLGATHAGAETSVARGGKGGPRRPGQGATRALSRGRGHVSAEPRQCTPRRAPGRVKAVGRAMAAPAGEGGGQGGHVRAMADRAGASTPGRRELGRGKLGRARRVAGRGRASQGRTPRVAPNTKPGDHERRPSSRPRAMSTPSQAPSHAAGTGRREMGRRGRVRGDGTSSPQGAMTARTGVMAVVPSGMGEVEREGARRCGREKGDEQGATGANDG
jgi:hypothetical protein